MGNIDIARGIAIELFGFENLKDDLDGILSPNALALLCKDSELELSFSGEFVNGFQFGFCNATKTVQTDVGVCIGSNTKQFLQNGNVIKHEMNKKLNNGLKDIEHIMIISVDRFGEEFEKNFKVCKKLFVNSKKANMFMSCYYVDF